MNLRQGIAAPPPSFRPHLRVCFFSLHWNFFLSLRLFQVNNKATVADPDSDLDQQIIFGPISDPCWKSIVNVLSCTADRQTEVKSQVKTERIASTQTSVSPFQVSIETEVWVEVDSVGVELLIAPLRLYCPDGEI